VTPEEHRRLGVELYNGTWELIERGDRTADEDDEMLHRAHASAYHWLHAAGATAANRARSQWLCSRVHAVVGQLEGALHHAQRCSALVEAHGDVMEDWDLAAAREALARAHLVAGDVEASRRQAELARAETATIAEADDRTSTPISTRWPCRRAGKRPRRMVETRVTSGSRGRRHSNGRIRVRCQLDRRPATQRRRPSLCLRAGQSARRVGLASRRGA
jgi:hypothetical protein